MCACSVHLYLYAELVYMRVMHGIPYAIEYRCSFTIHSMGIEHFWMVLSHSHLAMAPVWMCEFECTVYALCSIQFCFIKRNSCCMYTRYRYVYLRCTHTTKRTYFNGNWNLFSFEREKNEDKKNEVKIIIVHCCDLHQYSCTKDVCDHTFCCSYVRYFVRRQRCVNHTYVSR